MGFTLRRFPLPRGFAAFRLRRTHLPSAQRFFRRRSVRPARRASVSGFTPPGIALRLHGVLGRQPPAPPLGFSPLGPACENLAPDFSGPPLTCLAAPRDYSRMKPAPQSVYRLSPRPARPSPECRSAETTLLGFLHLPVPDHLSPPVPGLLSSPPAGPCIAADSPTVFGHLRNPAEAAQDRPWVPSIATFVRLTIALDDTVF
jgi:hypothetical protein